MKDIINYISSSPQYILFSIAVLGGVSVGMYWRYKYYLGVKKACNLEFKKFNLNFDNVLKDYIKFDEAKKNLLLKKNLLEKVAENNNFEEKWKSSPILQNNDVLEEIYKKLKRYKIGIATAEHDIERTKNVPKATEDEFNSIFKEYKEKCNLHFSNSFDNNLTNIDSNLEKLISFLKRTKTQDNNYIKALEEKFYNYKTIKYSMLRQIEVLEEVCTNLIKVYDNEWRNFMNLSDKLLSNNIKIFDEEIKNLNLEEKKFLDVNEVNLQFIKNYISIQNQLKVDIDMKKCLTTENIFDQKKILWENNVANKVFDNYYENCFWLYFDGFIKDVKKMLGYSSKKSSNLKFVDSNFEMEYVSDNTEIYDLFFRLYIFNLKIFLVSHIHYLKTIIPVCYLGVGLLVSYVLYKKLKFVYHCYKTKTLKVTFLNWLFDSEIVFTISKTGIFYCIAILGLLGLLYYLSGFGYWLAFIFCGRTLIWNWIKFGLYKLNEKYNWYKK